MKKSNRPGQLPFAAGGTRGRGKSFVQPVVDDPATLLHDTVLAAQPAHRNLLGHRPTGSRTGATREVVAAARLQVLCGLTLALRLSRLSWWVFLSDFG